MESTLIGKLTWLFFHHTNLTVDKRTRDIFRLSVVTVTGDGVLLASGVEEELRVSGSIVLSENLRDFLFGASRIEVADRFFLLIISFSCFEKTFNFLPVFFSLSFLDSLRRFSPRICHLAAIAGL